MGEPTALSRRRLLQLAAATTATGTAPATTAARPAGQGSGLTKVTGTDDRPEVVQIWDGNGGACSGALISEFHVLTAAHCVHDLHTNGEPTVPIEVYPARDERDFPFDCARVTHIRVHPDFEHVDRSIEVPWINQELGWDGPLVVDYDVALLTLDRRVGATTGTLEPQYPGHPDYVALGTVHGVGYPGDTPDNSTNTMWRSTGTIEGVLQDTRLCRWVRVRCTDGDTYGIEADHRKGMSGGPILSSNGGILAVVAAVLPVRAADRLGLTTMQAEPRITEAFATTQLHDWIAADRESEGRAPTATPLPVFDEFIWSGAAERHVLINGALRAEAVAGDDAVRIERGVRNVGPSAEGQLTVEFSLAGADTVLGTESVPMPDPYTATTVAW